MPPPYKIIHFVFLNKKKSTMDAIRFAGKRGDVREFLHPSLFFTLPREIQYDLLTNYGIDPQSIERLCDAAKTSPFSHPKDFVLNVCDNPDFWKYKLTRNFPEDVPEIETIPGLSEEDLLIYWKSLYLSAFARASKNFPNIVESGDTATVVRYLEGGVYPGMRNVNLSTALIIASREGHEDIVRWLLRYGALVNARGGNRFTALMAASGIGNLPIMRMLVQKKARVDEQDVYGATALYRAVTSGNLDAVNFLLNQGADPNARLREDLPTTGREAILLQAPTPLFVATLYRHSAIVDSLARHGADVNAKGRKWNAPIVMAAYHGDEDTVSVLLSHGAEPNVANSRGNTALMYGASQGKEKMVSDLLRHGANPLLKNKRGDTAISLAHKKGHRRLVGLLGRAAARFKAPS